MARAHVLVALLAAAAGYALLASSNQTSQLQVLLLNSVKDQPWLAEAVETLSLSVKRARLELDKLLGKTSDLVAQVPQNAVQDTLTASCKLYGKPAGCGCDFATVERLNLEYLNPLLYDLVRQPFFRYFKVNLYCDCQFWPDAGVCFQKDCCVHECDASEIPASWHEEDKAAAERHKAQTCKGDSGVDRSMNEGVKGALSSIAGWHGLNNPWVPGDDRGIDYIYVDLQRNPEKYTGYKGEDARRIWAAIYDQAALKEAAAAMAAAIKAKEDAHKAGAGAADKSNEEVGHLGALGVAKEQEVLFRLISGMHSSITTSIVQNYYNETSGTWGPNLPFFKARFASPASRPYVENLFFTLLFVMRAAQKARTVLASTVLTTGNPEEDRKTKEMMDRLLDSGVLSAACPTPFDESILWQHRDPGEREALRHSLQVAFHNITNLMDCVGCEKCKMHGKLNILGIAAAMKVLFSEAAGGADAAHLMLERNEVIALVNLLAKLSDSVETVRALNVVLDQQEAEKAAAAAAAAPAGNGIAQPPQAEGGHAHGSPRPAPGSAGQAAASSSHSGSQSQEAGSHQQTATAS